MKPCHIFGNFLRNALATCLMFMAANAGASDVTLFTLAKGVLNLQTNSSAPVAAALPFGYQARVWLTPSNTINAFGGASVKVTNQFFFSQPFTQLSLRSPLLLLELRFSYNTQNLLDGGYPSTNYVFHLPYFSGGSTNLFLALPSGSPPATAPHINNYAAAQAVDPAADFTVGWDAFTGGTANDFIELQVENISTNVFDTGTSVFAGLNGTATGVIIPANTLKAGHSYVGHLIFEKVMVTNTFYAPNFSGYFQQTDFYLATSGAVFPSLVSTVPAVGSSNVPGNVKIVFTFNERMAAFNSSILSIGSTNATTAALSTDGKTFTLTPVTPWPTNTVSMYFNPLGGASGGRLLFGDTNSNPLMSDILAARFTAGTNLLSATPSAPFLAILGPPSNGAVQLRLTGEAYRNYQLLASSNLMNWDSLNTVLATNTTVIFTDTVPAASTIREYRILATP